MKRFIFILCSFCVLFSCKEDITFADSIYHKATIYTVDDSLPYAEAIAVKGDRILFIGSEKEIKKYSNQETNWIDCRGNFLMPGFIEGHGHFAGMGELLLNVNLMRTSSWEEIVAEVKKKIDQSKPGEWIEGRGWHQEKWTSTPEQNVHGYPFHDDLSAISPENPVVLKHASGHSLFANNAAMEAAEVTKETKSPKGGEIIRDAEGTAVGVFEERAMGLINRAQRRYEAQLGEENLANKWYQGVELAQNECLSKGITSFQDAGSSLDELNDYSSLAKENKLSIRLWAMLRTTAERMEGNIKGVRQIGTGNNHFTCRAIKSELDGALGSFGAWLLSEYEDKPGFLGQNTTEIAELKEIATLAKSNDMQLCIHAIGDKANRKSLDVIEEFTTLESDFRWRIEHAQHLSTDDIKRFKELNCIASMQGIHCTSDAPFVEKRLGRKRAEEGAYPWRSLIDAGAVVTNGTDAPVEDVDPIQCFYASVTRKRIDTGFEFFPSQAMTRAEAIKSYTYNNAYAAFEDELKGSLKIGKLADMVLLSKNLLDVPDSEILQTKVLLTIVGGHIKFQNEDLFKPID